MNDLTESLRARLNEDEQAAVAAEKQRTSEREAVEYLIAAGAKIEITNDPVEPRSPVAGHIARHNPARVQAEVEAKRRILADLLAEPHYAWDERSEYGCPKYDTTWADIMGDAEQTCTCGRDERVERRIRILLRPYGDDQRP